MIIEETELFDKEVLIGGDLGYANKSRTKAITISDYGDGYRIRQYVSNGDMDWQRVENIPMQLPVKPELAEIVWLNPEKVRPKHGNEIICTSAVGMFRGTFETTRDGLVKINGNKRDIVYWDDIFEWLPYPQNYQEW